MFSGVLQLNALPRRSVGLTSRSRCSPMHGVAQCEELSYDHTTAIAVMIKPSQMSKTWSRDTGDHQLYKLSQHQTH